MNAMHLVVTYDVPSNRRRRRLHKKLHGFLNHVQKSVFEGELPEHRHPKLQEAIRREIDFAQDDVRIYRLCARCTPAVEILGTARVVEQETDVIA